MVGYWGLPGGFVERDEDPLVAVLRGSRRNQFGHPNPELLMVMGDPACTQTHVSIVYSVTVEEGGQRWNDAAMLVLATKCYFER